MRAGAARGLTLVEIMIAMAITAVIGAMVAGAFQRTSAARELTSGEDERYGPARTTLSRLANELSEAFLSDHYDRKRWREPPTVFLGRDLGERDELTFTTMAHVRRLRDVKESDQALVAYTVEPDPELPGQNALHRRERPSLDVDPTRGGAKAVVCQHVASFDVSYWDWKRQEWAREWMSNGAERSGTLPTRVRVRLSLSMPDGRVQAFETQARVALLKPLAF